ncbi:unnamed protein product, partial [Amoebophrya sp. A25]
PTLCTRQYTGSLSTCKTAENCRQQCFDAIYGKEPGLKYLTSARDKLATLKKQAESAAHAKAMASGNPAGGAVRAAKPKPKKLP